MKQVSEKKGKISSMDYTEKANQIYENTKYRRHFLNEEDIIGDYYAVTTQWNREELKHFLELTRRSVWRYLGKSDPSKVDY